MRRSLPEIPMFPTVLPCGLLFHRREDIRIYSTGEDYPGSVNYWIPFGGGLGINDAPWRTEFGGQIYDFEGTHGCICAPADQVQIIYSAVEKNTPVIIMDSCYFGAIVL